MLCSLVVKRSVQSLSVVVVVTVSSLGFCSRLLVGGLVTLVWLMGSPSSFFSIKEDSVQFITDLVVRSAGTCRCVFCLCCSCQ